MVDEAAVSPTVTSSAPSSPSSSTSISSGNHTPGRCTARRRRLRPPATSIAAEGADAAGVEAALEDALSLRPDRCEPPPM
jgi:hypothetical protein